MYRGNKMMTPQFYSSLVLLLVITLKNRGQGSLAGAQEPPQHESSTTRHEDGSGNPHFVDKFAAIQNTRVLEAGKNRTRIAELIHETLRNGGIQAGVENDDMNRCFSEHLEEEECFGITNTWSLCMPGLIVERHAEDGLFLMDWRVGIDVLNLYESHILKSMYACYKDGKWQLDTEDLSCPYLGTRPDWSLCQQGNSTSLEDLCATIKENDLVQISQQNESCAMWAAREVFQQLDRDFDQFLKSECGHARTQQQQLKRRQRVQYHPISRDRALYFEMAAGFPTDDFHLEYHGVTQIAHWWDFWNTSYLSFSDCTQRCRPYLKQQGYTALENSLVYGRTKSTIDVARVKFRGTIAGLRFYSSGHCYSVTSSNPVVPACNQYGCTISASGTVSLSVWCDMSTALPNGRDQKQQTLEWLDCHCLE